MGKSIFDKNRPVELEKKAGYCFKDSSILFTALTHSSYANENRSAGNKCNERLEFLGDAVLNTVISEWLYRKGTMPEGEMTKMRASLVCEVSLARCAKRLELGKYLFMGRGEMLSGGRQRDSILSDAFEALIGAVFIDGGMDKARGFIKKTMDYVFKEALNGAFFLDYKTKLQEAAQASGCSNITYKIVAQKGPEHDREYYSQLSVDGRILGSGKGRTKKEAEQYAAREALTRKGWYN